MDLTQSIALGAGLAWASGMRLYAALFAAGMLAHFGYIELPASLQVLQHPLVLATTGTLFLTEFLVDKVPGVDTISDLFQTFVRVPAGAVLAALAFAGHDPAMMLAAGLLGGTLAAGTHAAKAGSRALINTSPEPFSNIAASLTEDAMVAGGLYAALLHPAVFLGALLVFVIVLAWLLPKVWRGLRSLFARFARGGRAPAAGDRGV